MRPSTISLAEPVSALRHIPVLDNGEPLVNFLEVCPDLTLDEPRFIYRRETLVRKSVAEMLCTANASLMAKGFRLGIVEGWRPPHIQRRMYLGALARFSKKHPDWSAVKLRRVANRYVAPLHGKALPPHSTGGAVDLILADIDGRVLDHNSPFELTDHNGYLFDAHGLSETARRTRMLLKEALEPTGMTNYPSEYWHWTFGDQGWAYRGGHPHALYGSITPPDYSPAPEDVTDEPFVLKPLPPGRTMPRSGPVR